MSGPTQASSSPSATASLNALADYPYDSDDDSDNNIPDLSDAELDDLFDETAAAEINPTDYVADGSHASLTAFPSSSPSWTSHSTMNTPVYTWHLSKQGPTMASRVEEAQTQATRIRALLVDLLPRLWHLPQDTNITVRFMAEGDWNRAFIVELPCPPQADTDLATSPNPDADGGHSEPMVRRLVFRIALPVSPSTKIRSEVAAMRWGRQNTAIPVTRVFLYDPSYKNHFGYEWNLMDFMPGKPFSQAKLTMNVEQKRKVATVIAEWE